jgi:hypothetical protein
MYIDEDADDFTGAETTLERHHEDVLKERKV